MRKRWLGWCALYLLGLATLPGVLLTQRWLQSSEPARPKFTDAVEVSAVKADAVLEVGLTEDVFVEPAEIKSKKLKPPIDLDEEFGLETPGQQVVRPRQPAVPRPPVKDESDRTETLATPNPNEEEKAKLTTLREKLSELIKAKAELINEQTLSQEVSTLEKQISDLHAAQQLLKARQILNELVEQYPESPAAIRAKRMLEASGMKPSAWKGEPLRPLPEPVDGLPTYR